MEIDLSQVTTCFYGQVCYTNLTEVEITDPSIPVQSVLNLNDKYYLADILNGTDYIVCITLIPEVQKCAIFNAVNDDAEKSLEDPIFYFNGLSSQGFKYIAKVSNDTSIVYPDLNIPLELLIEKYENQKYQSVEIVDSDVNVQDNERLVF